MNILHINVTYQYGSTGKIVNAIHQSLLQDNHQSLVAYGRHFKDDHENTYKIGNLLSYTLHGIDTRLFDRHGFSSIGATKKFIKDVDFSQFDVIHLHNVHGYYLNIDLLFDELKRANRPVVWTLHDSWSYTGHCAFYVNAACDKWKTGCNHCPEKGEYPKSIGLDQSERNYEDKKEIFNRLDRLTLVTPSLWLQNELKASYLSKYPVKHILNGVDLSKFKPLKERQENEKFTILGVANIWEKRKGLDLFNKLAETLPDDYEIIIVGKIPSRITKHPKIMHIHRTDSVEELAKIYSQADCFLNPTLDDNLPTTTIEAIACGTPVITFDTGGSAEIIDSSCGCVIDKSDFHALLKAIETIKSQGKAFYEDNAHQRSTLFDKKLMISNYMDLYKEITS